MEKFKYEDPEMEVVRFVVEDVIRTSNEIGNNDDESDPDDRG